jgi:peptidoglycan L-alanyl-D-glutamate endopeptidase CwlK
MYSFSVKSLNLLNHPKFSPTLRLLMIEAIKDSPLDFTITETVRTLERQKELYTAGKSRTLKSRHIPQTNISGYAEACDIAPYPVDYKDLNRFRKLSEHIKKKAVQLGIPITWGGDWKTLVDMPHYELKR